MGRVDISIPHGGLGTNKVLNHLLVLLMLVSIPHGGLGTNKVLNHLLVLLMLVSIPHGGLGTKKKSLYACFLSIVSIPHGGLGTIIAFDFVTFLIFLSPSHTVGSEPQTTTLNKIRHNNHFVKVAPFSNEVNFPKSEVMQS